MGWYGPRSLWRALEVPSGQQNGLVIISEQALYNKTKRPKHGIGIQYPATQNAASIRGHTPIVSELTARSPPAASPGGCQEGARRP